MNTARPRAAAAALALALALAAATPTTRAADRPDIPALQSALDAGDPRRVLDGLAAALEADPENPRLLYNHGVAAYAAGRFDDALVSFDRAEYAGNRRLARQARFQKGNAEFRLGQASRTNNLDETITRWKLALGHFTGVLEETPDDPRADANFRHVRAALLRVLLEDARRHREAADGNAQRPAEQLESLRNAFEKYVDAREVDPDNEEARQGEEETRDQLAQALAEQGRRLANAPLRSRPNPREPSLPDLDTTPLEEGVGMLADANQLKPDDAGIQASLDDARNRLADADVMKARSYMMLEERIGWVREKLAVLRMAREIVEKALAEVPDHQPAEQTRQEINNRLAQIHEDEGDQQREQASNAPLEQQAMQLTQAYDHFQQAQELQPANDRLPPKIDQTGQELAKALDQMADQLMQNPGGQESLEQQIARLEGADQALGQLQSLQPSQRTDERAQQVSEQLEELRQQMAGKGQKPGEQPGGTTPQMSSTPGQQMFPMGAPMDSRPKIHTPGMKGEWNSRAMTSGRDY